MRLVVTLAACLLVAPHVVALASADPLPLSYEYTKDILPLVEDLTTPDAANLGPGNSQSMEADPSPSDGGGNFQDDARSGNDAPGSFADCVRLTPGTYYGDVFGPASATGVPVGPLDQDDWYCVQVDAGRRLTVRLEALPSDLSADPLFHIVLQVRTPEDALANWVVVTQGKPVDQSTIVTDRGGLWGLHVLTATLGGSYRFTMAVTDASAARVASAGNGYILYEFELGAGASAAIAVGATYEYRDLDPAQVTLKLIQSPNRLRLHAGDIYPSPSLSFGLDNHLKPVRLEPLPDSYSTLNRFTASFSEDEPGHYFLLVLAKTHASYLSAELVFSGDHVAVGGASGGEDSLRLARLHDYNAMLFFASALLGGSGYVTLRLEVQGSLFGHWDCDHGTIRGPDGLLAALPGADADIVNGPPGEWKLRRSEHVEAAGDHYIFFGADVDIPSSRQPS